MKKEFSIYLDLVRFLASVLVVIYHSNTRNVIADILPLSNYGHTAVMIFFVLSGFVIAFVAHEKEKSPRVYWISRAARILPVAVSALILPLIIDNIGQHLAPEFYLDKTTSDYWYIRFISSLFFLNEIWFVSIMAYSNVPYWSLCYEVWYYVLFSIFLFSKGKKRTVFLVLICLLLGPKILLLAPIWWLGVYLYKSNYFQNISELMGWVFFVSSIFLFWLFHYLNVKDVFSTFLHNQIGDYWYEHLTFSKFFLSDYLLAIIIFLNFAGFRVIGHRFSFLLRSEKIIRYLAGFTFSLYLFHQPLILFYAAIFNGDPNGWTFYTEVMLSVIVSVYFLGLLTERRKLFYRKLLTNVIDTLIVWVKKGLYRLNFS